MPDPVVALTRCTSYSETEISVCLKRQFELLGGLQKIVKPGDTVLLKPNFIAPKPRRRAVQTDPAVIIETARLLKDYGAKPFVGDSPAWGNAFSCVRALKMEDDLKKLAVPVKQLDNPRFCQIGKHHTKVGISSVALDADVIINLPKFKAHQQLVATFAVKNMFGCVCGKQKAFWHLAKGRSIYNFCEFLIDIFSFLNPAVSIIDAVTVMDGLGPIRGTAKPLGYLIGSADPIALETICSRLVDIDPNDLPMINTAQQLGFNCRSQEKHEIVGDDFPENILNSFVIPELIPVRFSAIQVCKSICRQIAILIKSAMRNRSSK